MTLNILCTNDDGYLSLGIGVLQRAATSLGDVVTVPQTVSKALRATL